MNWRQEFIVWAIWFWFNQDKYDQWAALTNAGWGPVDAYERVKNN